MNPTNKHVTIYYENNEGSYWVSGEENRNTGLRLKFLNLGWDLKDAPKFVR